MGKKPKKPGSVRASRREKAPTPRDTRRPVERRAPAAAEGDPSPQESAPRKRESTGAPHGPLVVGIGASAGGLEALEQFFSHVPEGSGLAYVVIQHLAPQHASMLPEILGRRTAMPVVQATDGVAAQPDHVYVIAPGTTLGISRGSFQVASAEAERHGQIDAFLRTLAEDQGGHAVGVLLSGSGADGTVGLRAIRDRGGLTLAQAPETAKYDDMPRSAIGAGLVDYVLPPKEMPEKLLDHARRVAEGRVRVVVSSLAPGPVEGVLEAPTGEQLASALDRVSEALRRSTGHDFSHYKRGTVLRRLRRRLQLRSSASLDQYLDFLGKDAEEANLLAKDLLIGVTQFFRDPDAFEYLRLHVLPQIIAVSGADAALRVWVPGCASGEEAYSLGVLLREQLAPMSSAPRVQIFATDIDVEAIAEARQARYPADVAEHVSPGRLARFFTRDGSTYQVAKEVRDMCIFSEHSLIRDPPFLGLHLISCRNLLIYLDAELQKKLVPLLHYALKPGGFLFLGPSESLADHPELFDTVHKRFRIFQRHESLAPPVVEFPPAGRMAPRAAPPALLPTAVPTQEQLVNVSFERMMLQEYTPPGAVVNERGDVLCVAGLTGPYLQPPAGVLSTNILDIAHASLRVELRTALHAAARSGKKVVRDDVQVEVNGTPRLLRLTVRPMVRARQNGLFAVILQEMASSVGPEAPEAAEPSVLGADSSSVIEQLESELRTTRGDLRATIEELESSNEELKSSNEELLSTNEEMQSANEELQSSQEELKSVNEELSTVNAELAHKVEELGRLNSDLQNLFGSSDVITLFLDLELRLTRFTPAARTLFRLIDADAGRPLSDLAPRFADQDLAAEASEVLRTLHAIERQVVTLDQRAWYLMRILPYRTIEDDIAGVVINLADVTRIKQAEAGLRRLATALVDSYDAITTLDLEGRILQWNRAAERMYGYAAGEAQQMNYEALVPPENRAQFHDRLAAVARGERLESLEVRRLAKDGRLLDVSLTFTRLADDRGRAVGIATTERDITDRKRTEIELKAAMESLREADRRKNDFLGMLSHELRNPLAPIRSSIYILDRAAPGSEEARRAQAVIDRQVGHMVRMIEDLLDVTRISSGKIHLQPERLDLNEIVQRTVEDHRGDFVQGQVGLEVVPAPEPVWVDGDPTRLAQVIGNLLHNAVKFTPPGGRTSVSVEADSARGQAVLRVEDSGRGIAPEILPHLFQPFTQADTSLDRGKGGLGLGLFFVKSLAEMHGGSVQAESAGADRGATFTVALPLRGAGPVEAHPPRTGTRGRARRVLIIDDNVDAASSFREGLELGGHSVEVAFSGAEGLEKARAFRPDVVICDIGLPVMDGYAVARAMRADPDLGRLALVALTGYAGPSDVSQAREAGFDAHLAKPPSIEEVEQVIEEVLGGAAESRPTKGRGP